jgi:hypothetical protein
MSASGMRINAYRKSEWLIELLNVKIVVFIQMISFLSLNTSPGKSGRHWRSATRER